MTFSYSNLHDVTNVIMEISEVGVQLPERLVALHLYVRQYAHMWGHMSPSVPEVEGMYAPRRGGYPFLRMYLWWSLCTVYSS